MLNCNSAVKFLDEAVEKFPDKMAFADDKRSLTYREFRYESCCIAGRLIECGFTGRPVAVIMDRSVSCVVSFMSALYSGNFYAPLDPLMPADRISRIFEVLKPAAVITDSEHYDMVREAADPFGVTTITAAEEDKYADCSYEMIRHAVGGVDPEDPCYVLFTSGSSGIPKGVAVSHRSVMAFAKWASQAFGFDDSLILGGQTPLFFSMSVFDIYQTMYNCGSMYIIPRQMFSFPLKLLEFLDDKDINTIYWVPSALCLISDSGALDSCCVGSLKNIFFSGEAMPVRQLNVWRRSLPGARYVNLYGATETTDVCTYYTIDTELAEDEALPIGDAVPGCKLMVLGEDDREVSGSEAGELCVAGDILAMGYYNDPEVTAKAFVRNPLVSDREEIMYRTGDLVRKNENGDLVFDSRKGLLIKHLGHRIEPGEIETAASALPGIDRCCCIYDNGRRELLLYVAGDASEEEIRGALGAKLPPYMMPGSIIRVGTMPLNRNGKIDRSRLRQYDEENGKDINAEYIKSLINNYYGREVVTDHDQDLLTTTMLPSLLVIKLMVTIESRLGVRMRPEDIIPENFATVRAISALIEGRKEGSYELRSRI